MARRRQEKRSLISSISSSVRMRSNVASASNATLRTRQAGDPASHRSPWIQRNRGSEQRQARWGIVYSEDWWQSIASARSGTPLMSAMFPAGLLAGCWKGVLEGLYRNDSIEPSIAGFIDHAHPTGP